MTIEPGAQPTCPESPPARCSVGGIDLGLFVLVTVLVWGLFAFDLGPWQDDVRGIGSARDALNGGETPLAMSRELPTRLFGRSIFVVAVLTSSPVVFLTFLYGITWLATGMLAASILYVGDRPVAFSLVPGSMQRSHNSREANSVTPAT